MKQQFEYAKEAVLGHWKKILPDWMREVIEGIREASGRQKVDYTEMRAEVLRSVDEQTRTVRDVIYVRPSYTISLSPVDMKDIERGAFQSIMETSLADEARTHIKERGYAMNGELSVQIRGDERIQPGFLGVSAAWRQNAPGRMDFHTIRAPRGRPAAILVVMSGPQKNTEYPLIRFPVTIGREADEESQADIRLLDPDRAMSRTHLSIEMEDGMLTVFDPGSDNGTGLIGVEDPMLPMKRHYLKQSARLQLTRAIMVEIRLPESEAAEGTATTAMQA